MSLEIQLNHMIQMAGTDCVNSLKWRRNQLVDLHSEVKKGASSGSNVDEEFRKTCLAIEKATNLLEEIEVLNVSVLQSDPSKIVDIKTDGTLYQLQETVQEMFNLQKAPKRGCVYVSWCPSPEDFYYVGVATDVHRINMMFQEKLATTFGEGRWLSLLFPTQSGAWMLESIENALLTIIQHYMGRLPQLNTADLIESLLERVEIYTRESTSLAKAEDSRSPAYA